MLAFACCPSGAAAFQIGLADSLFGSSGTPDAWFDRAVDARTGLVRIDFSWAKVAGPTRPVDPSNPFDPAYDFTDLDAGIAKVQARGLTALLTIVDAPPWAEGGGRPASAPNGTWDPQPAELELFARALATRYAGGGFSGLPAVRYFQLWNEPNLSVYLNPQWQGGRPASPTIYRGMLNAFYDGIKSVIPSAQVLTAGTAPYGDGPGGQRMRPALFWRSLLCLKGQSLRTLDCPDAAHFDIAALNAIDAHGPTVHAINKDDISTPDLSRLKRILAKARKSGRSLPAGRKPLWVTEFWWDSNPPDPKGVPAHRQALWLEQGLYLFWKQGAKAALWFQIRDAAPDPDFASTFQTGLFQLDGAPKPAYRAFRFPFVSERLNRQRVKVWGMAPAAVNVRVQRKAGSRWLTIRRLRARGDRVFVGTLRLRGSARLRARARGEVSLAWRQR